MEVDDVDAEFTEPVFAAGEVLVFADDDSLETELADEAAAIPARGERGDHDEVAIGLLAACVAEGVGFAVDAGVGLLDAAVVASADERGCSILLGAEDSGADGEAAFGETGAGFFESDGEHGFVVRRGHGLFRILTESCVWLFVNGFS